MKRLMSSSRCVPFKRLRSSDESRLLRNLPVSFLSCAISLLTCLSLSRYGVSCARTIIAKLATRINTLNMVNTRLLSMFFTSPGISNRDQHEQNFFRSCDVFLPQKSTKDTKSFQVQHPDVAFRGVSGVVENLSVRREIDTANLGFVRGEYLANSLRLYFAEIGLAVEGQTELKAFRQPHRTTAKLHQLLVLIRLE